MKQLQEADNKNLKRLHLFFLISVMIAGAIFYQFVQSSGEMIYSTSSWHFIIASIFMLFGIFVGSKIYTININNAAKVNFEGYQEAMMNFKSANMAKWGAIHGPSLVAILLAHFSNNALIFIPAMVGVLFLYVSRPKAEHFNLYNYPEA